MTDTTNDIVAAVRSGWPQIMAIFAVVWWARKIDLRGKSHDDRLDRYEARLSGFEQTQQTQAIQLTRIEETCSAMKLTLDRMYSEMRDRE